MLRNALKTRALINSMLEIDKAAMGILTISDCTLSRILKTAFIEVFDLVDPVVADALEESNSLKKFRGLLSDNQVYLEADESHLDRRIRTDETKMCLIITNLLSNAFQVQAEKCLSEMPRRWSIDPGFGERRWAGHPREFSQADL